jgi:hypothetical protein
MMFGFHRFYSAIQTDNQIQLARAEYYADEKESCTATPNDLTLRFLQILII